MKLDMFVQQRRNTKRGRGMKKRRGKRIKGREIIEA